MLSSRPGAAVMLSLLAAACGRSEIPGVQVKMSLDRSNDFFAAPMPSVDLQGPGGRYDLSRFPGRDEADFLGVAFELIEEEADGAGLASAVFFQLTGAVDEDLLPDIFASVREDSAVFLLNVDDPNSPQYLERHPIDVEFRARDAGRHGTANQLSLLPLQGAPLRPHTLYAAVVLRDLGDPDGHLLGVSPTMMRLAAGRRPEDLDAEDFKAFERALEALVADGIRLDHIAGLAVFETSDPTAQTRAVREYALANHLPRLGDALEVSDFFEDYCTFHTTVEMPVYQDGDPPYFSGGGRWRFDTLGRPILRGHQPANVWITIPRQVMPEGGFPLAVFVRTGGGGERPLVDRGTSVDPTFNGPVEPGTGPALWFARAGYAGISIDGPHGGLRNPQGWDEQLLVFNFLNPAALRDNIRQSALELSLIPAMLAGWSFDASACEGVSALRGEAEVYFDPERSALMGHSTGATIAPLAVALEPHFRGLILSGAGGSYIQNIMEKQSPYPILPFAEASLGYGEDEHLYTQAPLLSIVQWAADPADPVAYMREIVHEPGTEFPRHVLMLQGIVDTYNPPPIANAASLALGLDLAGPALDAQSPALDEFRSLSQLLGLAGRSQVRLPAQGNVGGGITAVVVQHEEDGIQDGHEVAFQRPAPKYQYQCFLRTLGPGPPLVPKGEDPRCE